MAWQDGRWHCELCDQLVDGQGPWCELYRDGYRTMCRPLTKVLLNAADANGDGPMVNALCAYGRVRWGEDLDW